MESKVTAEKNDSDIQQREAKMESKRDKKESASVVVWMEMSPVDSSI